MGVNYRQGDHSLTHSFLPIADGELHETRTFLEGEKAKKGLAVGLRLAHVLESLRKFFKVLIPRPCLPET